VSNKVITVSGALLRRPGEALEKHGVRKGNGVAEGERSESCSREGERSREGSTREAGRVLNTRKKQLAQKVGTSLLTIPTSRKGRPETGGGVVWTGPGGGAEGAPSESLWFSGDPLCDRALSSRTMASVKGLALKSRPESEYRWCVGLPRNIR